MMSHYVQWTIERTNVFGEVAVRTRDRNNQFVFRITDKVSNFVTTYLKQFGLNESDCLFTINGRDLQENLCFMDCSDMEDIIEVCRFSNYSTNQMAIHVENTCQSHSSIIPIESNQYILEWIKKHIDRSEESISKRYAC